MSTSSPSPLTARRGAPLEGRVRVPGDKSISHRALILGALARRRHPHHRPPRRRGRAHTAEAMRAMGARVERHRPGTWQIDGVGVGGFAAPDAPLDFGNSGTGVRLVMGVVARPPHHGDLRRRRLAAPPADAAHPRSAGADGRAGCPREGGRPLPITLAGAREPLPIVYRTPVASAQVKSAVLLAGLNSAGRHHGDRTRGDARPHRTDAAAFRRRRDSRARGRAWPQDHAARPARAARRDVTVPGDPSSAAFPMVAARSCRVRRLSTT